MPMPKKVYLQESSEELQEMKRDEVVEGLNDKQICFCEYFARNYNIKTAAAKAGYSGKSSHMAGYALRKSYKVNRYIAWLKLRMTQKTIVTAADIVEKYARIAFSDITDFCIIKGNKLTLRDDTEIDGQLVKSIKNDMNGIKIEMYDKLHALKRLEDYFQVIPDDWKKKIEERKLEIMEEKLKLEKAKVGFGAEVEEDDGFLEALREEAEVVWEGEENE